MNARKIVAPADYAQHTPGGMRAVAKMRTAAHLEPQGAIASLRAWLRRRRTSAARGKATPLPYYSPTGCVVWCDPRL